MRGMLVRPPVAMKILSPWIFASVPSFKVTSRVWLLTKAAVPL